MAHLRVFYRIFIDRTPLVARVIYLVLVLPDSGSNGSGNSSEALLPWEHESVWLRFIHTGRFHSFSRWAHFVGEVYRASNKDPQEIPRTISQKIQVLPPPIVARVVDRQCLAAYVRKTTRKGSREDVWLVSSAAEPTSGAGTIHYSFLGVIHETVRVVPTRNVHVAP